MQGGPRHADAVALGEADETWPRIVEDAVRGTLKEVYAPMDDFGQERKPSLQPYPEIPWDKIKSNSICSLAYCIRCSSAWARLPVWLRVLHGDGIFWRLNPLSYQ